MVKELEAVDFDVALEPVFRGNGQVIPHNKLIINKTLNAPVFMVSDKYELLPNRDTILPVVENYLKAGWKLVSRPGGRSSVRVESEGRRVFVEMINPEVRIDMSTTHNGKHEVIMPRAILANSYDKTTPLIARYSAIVEWCANGAVRPMGKDMMSFISRRHSGIHVRQFDNDGFIEQAHMFNDGFESYLDGFRKMEHMFPSEEQAMDAIHEVTIRKDEEVINRMDAPLGRASSWQVFQGITNYLSYDFKGGELLNNRLQKKALAILEQSNYIKAN